MNNMNAINLMITPSHECNSKDDRYAEQSECSHASKRLLKLAMMLPVGQHLAIQIEFDMNQKMHCFVFASKDADVCADDFDWIFGKCAEVSVSSSCPINKMFSPSREVYALQLEQGEFSSEDDEDSFEDLLCCENHKKDIFRSNDTYLCELMEILCASNSYVQFYLIRTEDGINGMIAISTPSTMPLRMKSAISLTFPDAMATPIPAESEDELLHASVHSLYVESCMRHLLEHLRDRALKEMKENDKKQESSKEPTSLMKLNQLIGLDEVKSQVKRIIAFAQMKKELSDSARNSSSLSLNMEFIGNPGTAKTTVARLTAGILHESGLLKSSSIIEVGRADLVGTYAGETASKVKAVFAKAQGKVLFIDEAYSLVDHWDNSHGDEAINTIVQEMENHREETIVIFSGYPDKMNDFFRRNHGLRSRVPFTINFQDYSTQELLKIVELEAKNHAFTVSENAKDRLTSICNLATYNQEAGNGRFCRNLVESAILNYATRVYGEAMETPVHEFELEADDFTAPGFLNTEKKKPYQIGFRPDCAS